MANLIYDKALSFGKMDPIVSNSFPDDINLGKVAGSTDHYPGKEFTGAGRLTVDVCFKEPAGGTNVSIVVLHSEDGVSGWAPVGMHNSIPLAEMQAGPCQVAISPGNYQYLRVQLSLSGAFTGSAEAFLNTYAGK